MKDSLIVLILFLLGNMQAHAQYIDPGSGSYFFQIILGGFLVLVFYYKVILFRIRSILTYMFRSGKKGNNAH